MPLVDLYLNFIKFEMVMTSLRRHLCFLQLIARAANHSDFGGVLPDFLRHSAHSDIFEIPPLFVILLFKKKKVVRILFGRLV